ncbi:MAG: hypothetical protein PHF86_00810 [Candidatus Nanoarchaeia archaeon]|nr:hypothetical protein [Candidatus Nanoarchaeia archaeon]
MQKFNTVFKEKQAKVEDLFEKKLLSQFKRVYTALLEKYGIAEFQELTEEYQPAFLSELHSYWSEEEGISEKGTKFLNTKEYTLNEQSTIDQKKNHLQNKAQSIISETLRQSNIKWKLYGIIDEMYKEVKAKDLSDVLPPKDLFESIKESFVKSLKELLIEVNYELKENSNSEKLYEKEFSEEKRKELAKTGAALPDGSYPIESKKDLENAIHAYGRAKNKAVAKKHIIKRARALGFTSKLPENW